MRGEDLQELTIDELTHLERRIDIGLTRVLERKVYMYIYFIIQILGQLIAQH